MARVVVVNDDPDILNLAQTRLRQRGHKVVTVASGSDAPQALAERGAPDVAVLDVSMPEMTGLELLQELRQRGGLQDPRRCSCLPGCCPTTSRLAGGWVPPS